MYADIILHNNQKTPMHVSGGYWTQLTAVYVSPGPQNTS